MRKNISGIHTGETQSIGVVSGKKGEGNTTMTICIASYLSGVKRLRTAAVEIGRVRDFERIEEMYFGGKDRIASGEGFSLYNVDYYHIDDISGIGWIYGEGYDCVVVDFGTEYEKYMEELIRCSMKIVLGSVNMWRYEEYLKLCTYLESVTGGDRWFHIIGGDADDVRKHLKRYRLSGVPRINIETPYIIGNKQLEFFQKII